MCFQICLSWLTVDNIKNSINTGRWCLWERLSIREQISKLIEIVIFIVNFKFSNLGSSYLQVTKQWSCWFAIEAWRESYYIQGNNQRIAKPKSKLLVQGPWGASHLLKSVSRHDYSLWQSNFVMGLPRFLSSSFASVHLQMKHDEIQAFVIVKRLGLGLGTWDLGPGTWDLGPGI